MSLFLNNLAQVLVLVIGFHLWIDSKFGYSTHLRVTFMDEVGSFPTISNVTRKRSNGRRLLPLLVGSYGIDFSDLLFYLIIIFSWCHSFSVFVFLLICLFFFFLLLIFSYWSVFSYTLMLCKWFKNLICLYVLNYWCCRIVYAPAFLVWERRNAWFPLHWVK